MVLSLFLLHFTFRVALLHLMQKSSIIMAQLVSVVV
nr:MAG TPA: hypothetical protein [Microviridae sp.]